MLEMSKEEQEERIKTRHQGSKQAVEMMRVGLILSFVSNLIIATDSTILIVDFLGSLRICSGFL